MNIKQMIVRRDIRIKNMIAKKEDYEVFIERVTKIMDKLKTTQVCYPNEDLAIIQYME